MIKKDTSKFEINKEIKELVVTRIEAQTPQNLKLSIGSCGNLTKDEVIGHIEKGDLIGRQVVNMHLSFLKAVASGKFTKAISSV